MPKSHHCIFCGSDNVDDNGWKTGDGTTGPQCQSCGATGESVELWNNRDWLIDAVSIAVDHAIRKGACATYEDLSSIVESIVSSVGAEHNGSV